MKAVNCAYAVANFGMQPLSDDELESFIHIIKNCEGCSAVLFSSRGVWWDAAARRPELSSLLAAKSMRVEFAPAQPRT